ncbi:Hypothetical protein FKW44_021959 [Caligus rogercresseyi]|uniref:Uncharacterized protein n=1 Tax=Caligus rogercresseyi TaxID=217165 RepID=A0A7T8GS25_CALRO|nr:Hypothetical protein FKW44_021959 [Caligus rogercresseyi]
MIDGNVRRPGVFRTKNPQQVRWFVYSGPTERRCLHSSFAGQEDRHRGYYKVLRYTVLPWF